MALRPMKQEREKIYLLNIFLGMVISKYLDREVGAFKSNLVSYQCAQSCPTLCNLMDYSPLGSSVYGIFPGKSTRLGCHFLFQRVFVTQGSNLPLEVREPSNKEWMVGAMNGGYKWGHQITGRSWIVRGETEKLKMTSNTHTMKVMMKQRATW